jgi:hypothetical protein
MTKATGIYFAAAAILINIVATLFTVKFDSSKKKVVFALAPAVIALTTTASVWVSWRSYSLSFGSPTVGPSDTVPGGFNVLTDQQAVISNFVGAFFNANINLSYSVFLSPLRWTIICGIFFVIWAMLSGRRNRRRNIFIGIALAIATFGYFGIILFSYLTVFGPGEAVGLASYDRYIGTWYQGVFFALVILIVSKFSLAKYFEQVAHSGEVGISLSIRKQVSVFLIAFIGVATLSSVHNYMLMLSVSTTQGSEVRKSFTPVLEAIANADMPRQSKVYIISQHTVGFEYYVLRYEMLDAKFGKVPWSIGSPFGDGDIWTDPNWDAKKWEQELRDYDYVVLYKTTESFNNEFGSLFESGIVDPNSVYQIVKTEDTVSLSKIS